MKEDIKNELRQEIKKELIAENQSIFDTSKFSLRGYGVINYYNYKFDTDTNIKDKFDAERLNLYLEYKFTDKINFSSYLLINYYLFPATVFMND